MNVCVCVCTHTLYRAHLIYYLPHVRVCVTECKHMYIVLSIVNSSVSACLFSHAVKQSLVAKDPGICS